METSLVARSIFIFCVGGSAGDWWWYLVWLWLREVRRAWLAGLGGIILFLYGVIPAFQPAHFGRVYTAYGGVFVGRFSELVGRLAGYRTGGI